MTETINRKNYLHSLSNIPYVQETSSHIVEGNSRIKSKGSSLFERDSHRNSQHEINTPNKTPPARTQIKRPGVIYSRASKESAANTQLDISQSRRSSLCKSPLERRSCNISQQSSRIEFSANKEFVNEQQKPCRQPSNIFSQNMMRNYDDQLHDGLYQAPQIELDDICIKEPKYYHPEEVIPPKQRPTNLQPPERKIVEYHHHENQHVGSSCNVLDYNRGGDSFNKQDNSKQQIGSGWKLEPARVKHSGNSRLDPEQLARLNSESNTPLEYTFEKIVQENLKLVNMRPQITQQSSRQSLQKGISRKENADPQPRFNFPAVPEQKSLDNIKNRGKTAPKTYQNTVVHHSRYLEKNTAWPELNQNIINKQLEVKNVGYGHDEGRLSYSKNNEKSDVIPATSKPLFSIRGNINNENVAPAMVQDPIPTKNTLKSGIPSGIKSASLLKDSRETTSRRTSFGLSQDPQRKISTHGKTLEYHKISHSTTNILSPLVPHGQIVERKPQENYEITAYGQKEIRRSEKPENILANLDALKTKLGKISSSNQPSMSLGRADLSTNKNTPHSTAFNSENNSLQSIPLTSLPKPTEEHQRDLFRYDNSSKYGTLLINEQPDSSKGVTPREQSFKQHYTRFQGEVRNYPDEKPPSSNYSSRSSYIKVNELLPSATHRELRHSHRAVSQTPATHNGQGAKTEFSPINHRNNDNNEMRFSRDSRRSSQLGLLVEEYQNSASKLKRSKSETGVRRPLPSQKEPESAFLHSLKGMVKSTKNFLANKLQLPDARLKCSCFGDLSRDETCGKAMKWLTVRYKHSELEYLKKTYEKLQTEAEIDPKSQKQIRLDVSRTFPECKYYSAEGGGLVELQRVLECFARYDPQVGYVQGMNFIAASFLYHAEEYIAFWLLVMAFELFEMRDIFMSNLPGLTKHSQIIDFLTLNQIPRLHNHFSENDVRVEMFSTEWICGLFGSVIPIEKMTIFLDAFIYRGWSFFYRVVLSLLLTYQEEMLQAEDLSEILLIFKSELNLNVRVSPRSKRRRNIIWEDVFNAANEIQIDDVFISSLHTRFDPEVGAFNIAAESLHPTADF